MKFVIVPEDVAIVDRYQKAVNIKRSEDAPAVPWVVPHEDFVMNNLCAHPELSKGGEGMRRQRKLMNAFDGCKAGDVIGVEDADYRVVLVICGVLEWTPLFAKYASQLLPHVEAWEAAGKQDEAWKKKNEQAKPDATVGT